MVLEYLLTVVGLSLFEVINSIDNAIINSEVLSILKGKQEYQATDSLRSKAN